MEFKGIINAGRIEAEFSSDFSNLDPDLLILGFSSVGGGQVLHEKDTAAPGGKARVALQLDANGTLEVMVATGHEEDTGRLRVSCDGTVRHDLPVRSAAHWVYSVES